MKRFRIAIVIVLFLSAALAAALLWYAVDRAPSWYQPPDPDDVQVVQRAEQVEYRLVQEVQKIRDESEDWTLTLHEDQINAWLVARLPEWIAHDGEMNWPGELGSPQVHVTSVGIEIALPVIWSGHEQIVVTNIVPTLTEGALRIDVEQFSLGRLPIPDELSDQVLSALEDLARQAAETDDQEALAQLLKHGGTVDPVVEIADGRLVELNTLHLVDGELRLTSTTRLPNR